MYIYVNTTSERIIDKMAAQIPVNTTSERIIDKMAAQIPNTIKFHKLEYSKWLRFESPMNFIPDNATSMHNYKEITSLAIKINDLEKRRNSSAIPFNQKKARSTFSLTTTVFLSKRGTF